MSSEGLQKAALAQSAPCLAATAERTQRHPQDGTESKLIYKKKGKRKEQRRKENFTEDFEQKKGAEMQRKETLGQEEPGTGVAWNCVCLQVEGEEEDLEYRGTLHCSQVFVLIWGTPSYHWVLSGLVGEGRS